MPARTILLAALGAACAGCSAPAISTALAPDDPANQAAPQAAFVRPANVMASAPPAPPPAGTMPRQGGDMAGMKMDDGQ